MELVRGESHNFCVLQYVSLYNQEATISRGNHSRCGSEPSSAHTHLALSGNEYKVHSKS